MHDSVVCQAAFEGHAKCPQQTCCEIHARDNCLWSEGALEQQRGLCYWVGRL